MKKSYLFGMFALAAMTMVGCSNDEVVNDYSQDNAIEFGTYVGRGASSRAHVIDTKTLGAEGFGVFAYYTGQNPFTGKETPNFMYNEEVTNTTWDEQKNEFTGDWTYSPIKYWPNNLGDKVTFLAYAPYNKDTKIAEITGENANNTSISYTVPLTVTEQKDLLYLCQTIDQATGEDCKTIDLTKQSVTDKVEFHFLHALSRIGFNAEVMVDMVNGDQTGDADDADTYQKEVKLADGTKIVINSVTLSGKFYPSGTLNLNEGEWTPATATKVVYYKLTQDNFGQGNPSFTFTNKDGKNKRPLNNFESYIMIIPQDFTKATAPEDKITVTIAYDVFTEDAALPKIEGWGKGSLVKNVVTSDPFTIDFQQGKAYNFTLHIGMTSVKLSATVEGWGEITDIAVNVPINK